MINHKLAEEIQTKTNNFIMSIIIVCKIGQSRGLVISKHAHATVLA